MNKSPKYIVSKFLTEIDNEEISYVIRKLLITGLACEVEEDVDLDIFSFNNETEYINDVYNTVVNKMDNIDYIRKIINLSILEHEKWLSHFTDEQITESIVDFLSLEPDTNQLSEEQMALYGQKLFNLQAELAELQGVWDISFDDDGNCTSMISF